MGVLISHRSNATSSVQGLQTIVLATAENHRLITKGSARDHTYKLAGNIHRLAPALGLQQIDTVLAQLQVLHKRVAAALQLLQDCDESSPECARAGSLAVDILTHAEYLRDLRRHVRRRTVSEAYSSMTLKCVEFPAN